MAIGIVISVVLALVAGLALVKPVIIDCPGKIPASRFWGVSIAIGTVAGFAGSFVGWLMR